MKYSQSNTGALEYSGIQDFRLMPIFFDLDHELWEAVR